MSMESKKAVESFSRSLAELTVNSKPHINFLTMFAQENSYQAEAIVETVHDQLRKASTLIKLPILYLIDSIMKNVGKDYIRLFSPVLVSNFANIYIEVDTSSRQLMRVLRQTWNGIISSTDLSKLDIQVHAFDHQWELASDTLKNTTIKILLNPSFLPQKVTKDSIEEELPKTDQELTDEIDEAEILREQLLLQKKKRELEKMKMLAEKSSVCNNENPTCEEIIYLPSEAPVSSDLDVREIQVDSTTVDSEVQPSPSGTPDKPAPELWKLLTNLIAKQNQKSEKHQIEKNKNKESVSDQSLSGRYSERYTHRRSYENSCEYDYPRNKSSDRRHDHNYSNQRDDKNKYIHRKQVLDCKVVSKEHQCNQGLPSSRGSQCKGQLPKVTTGSEDCLASTVSTSNSTSAVHSSQGNSLEPQPACSVSSSYKPYPLTSPEQQQVLSECIPQSQIPVDFHSNISGIKGNFSHYSRGYKKALLPTPAQPQGVLPVLNTQTKTNGLGLCHSTKQFLCTSIKKQGIKLKKEIDYNHGFGCPQKKLVIEPPSSSPQIMNQQSLLPLPQWHPSSYGKLVIKPKPASSSPQIMNQQSLLPPPRPYPSSYGDMKNLGPPLVGVCLESPPLLLPPASNYILGKIAQDTVRTIFVDNVTKEVQFYGETGVINSGEDNPREITFKSSEASVSVNGVVVHSTFNQPETKVRVGPNIFRVRLGAPTRELYINDEAFQCQFNFPPEQIQLSSGEVLSVQLLSKATPLVQLGSIRRDLVAGHVFLTIDSLTQRRILLHAKPQRFDIAGVPHILKFADALQTIFINDYLVNLKFGGPPLLINVNGSKHLLQLSDLPFDVIPGEVNIASMAQTENGPYTIPNDLCGEAIMPSVSASIVSPVKSNCIAKEKRKQNLRNSDSSKKRKMSPQPSTRIKNMLEESNNSNLPDNNCNIERDYPTYYPNSNIHSLFQSLCDVGLLIPRNQLNCPEKVQSSDVEIHFVNFEDLSTLKRKQPGMVEILHSGIQCNSCGIRFPPELTGMYREHLDWHFQKNHKIRKTAHTRPWYCAKPIWIQFEGNQDRIEMEDGSVTKDCDDSATVNCSVSSHGYPQGTICEMCGDTFDDFFNEDQDEWHLKNCVLFEKKLYHPACLNDHQASTTIGTVAEFIMGADETVPNQNEIGAERGDRTTGCAVDLASEINGNPEVLDTSSVISVDVALSPKEIESTGIDGNNDGSHILNRDEELSKGESKVALIEIKEIENNAVNAVDSGYVEETSSYPITPNTPVSNPTNICDNNVLEGSVQDVSEECLKPKLVGRKLSQLPPINKGSETSNMCSLS